MPTLPDVQSFGARQAPVAGRGISQPRAPNTAEMQIYSAPAQIAGANVSDFAQRQLARRDIVSESNIEAEYMSLGEEMVRTAQTTMDLADEANVTKVGGELLAKQNELLARHQGSLESRTRLERSLIGQRARMAGTLGAASAAAEMAKVDGVVKRKLAPLPTMAFNDPTMLDDVLRQGYAEIDAKANIYTPEELQAKKDGFATLVASAAVTGTVSRARRPEELAEIQQALTTNPGLIEALGPTAFLQMQQEINNQYIGMIAEQNKPEKLIEIYDATSPTQSRLVPESQAVGAAAPGKVPSVIVNNGETGPTLSKDGQSVLVVDPTAPSGFRMVPITGGEADQAVAKARGAAAAGAEMAQTQMNVATRDVSRILDIIEESGGGTGPIEGLVGGYLPTSAASRIAPFLGSIKSMVVRDTMEGMRASSTSGATGFGAMNEQELKIVEDAKGRISPEMEERDLFNNLLTIVEGQAKAAFGTDQEIATAEGNGDITAAQAAAMRDQRDRVVDNFRVRADGIVASIEGKKAAPTPGAGRFNSTLAAVRKDPTAFTPEDIAAMDFTPEQFRQLGEAYATATGGGAQAPGSVAAAEAPAELTITRRGGADGQIDPVIIDEIAAFAQATPDAGQYFEQMANILDAADEAGIEMTLEEALARAKGGGGG